jgi:RNA polymerase sigma-70 factor (ECF subfamily)
MEFSVRSLFEQHADGVYTLAYRMLHDRYTAEDVVQETFLAILRGRAPYRGDGPIAGWVYRIGYRQAIQAMRRRRDVPTESESILRQADRALPGAETALLVKELAERVDSAIQALSPPLRAAFVLRDVEALSTAEVANVLGISQSAVKMRLARAREQLRTELEDYLR